MSAPDKPDGRGNRERAQELVKALGLCQFCAPNKGCNRHGRRQPKCDRTKNKRR